MKQTHSQSSILETTPTLSNGHGDLQMNADYLERASGKEEEKAPDPAVKCLEWTMLSPRGHGSGVRTDNSGLAVETFGKFIIHLGLSVLLLPM